MTKVYNMVNRDVYTVDGRGSVHSLGEQHDRDDEGVHIPFTAVAERVKRRGLAPAPLATDQQETLVAGVGAPA
jgi:hypothetical protein